LQANSIDAAGSPAKRALSAALVNSMATSVADNPIISPPLIRLGRRGDCYTVACPVVIHHLSDLSKQFLCLEWNSVFVYAITTAAAIVSAAWLPTRSIAALVARLPATLGLALQLHVVDVNRQVGLALVFAL